MRYVSVQCVVLALWVCVRLSFQGSHAAATGAPPLPSGCLHPRCYLSLLPCHQKVALLTPPQSSSPNTNKRKWRLWWLSGAKLQDESVIFKIKTERSCVFSSTSTSLWKTWIFRSGCQRAEYLWQTRTNIQHFQCAPICKISHTCRCAPAESTLALTNFNYLIDPQSAT